MVRVSMTSAATPVYAAVVAAGMLMALPVLAAGSPFDGLTGGWGGSGSIKWSDGSSEKMRCNAKYTGGGAALAMAINCTNADRNVNISGNLRNSGGRVTGSWAESNLGASGSASGRASEGRLSLGLGGTVSGSMSVSFSDSRQSIAISISGAPLTSVTMSLSKR